MKKLGIVAVVLVVVYMLIQWSRTDYLEFDRQREAWHRRCDAYRQTQKNAPPAAIVAACQREAEELIAYAQRKGWTQVPR